MLQLEKALKFIFTALLLLLLLGLIWTPYSASEQDFREFAFDGFSIGHPFGIDGLGRDFFSRIWKGSAHTFALSFLSMVLAFSLATLLLFTEQRGSRFLSSFIRQLVGIWVAVPVIFIGLLLLVSLKPSVFTLILAVGIGNVPITFRQLRVEWISLMSEPYVEASRSLGTQGLLFFRKTVFPNLGFAVWGVVRLVLAISTLEFSGLAFLGLLGDPDFAELGSIMKQNQAYLYVAPHLVILPGAILATGLLFLQFSDSVVFGLKAKKYT